MTDLKTAIRAIIMGSLLLLVASCASIPPVSTETGMLLIPIHYKKVTAGSPFAKYRIVLDDGSVTYIYADKSHGLIKDLAPGSYKIEYFEAVFVDSGRLWRDSKADVSFEIEAGKITTADDWLRVRLYKHSKGLYQQGYFESMTQSQKESKMREFSANNELVGWVLQ